MTSAIAEYRVTPNIYSYIATRYYLHQSLASLMWADPIFMQAGHLYFVQYKYLTQDTESNN